MAWVSLHLTSPHMRDGHGALQGKHEVHAIQYLMNKYLHGSLPQDGEYGLHTAQTVRVAKDHLGYPKRKINSIAGAKFYGYISNPKTRTPYMKWLAARRAKERARLAKLKPKRVKALEWLGANLGMHEVPAGSNHCAATVWYGFDGPWCAMVGSESGVAAGQKSFVRGSRYSYCPFVTADAMANRNGLSVTHDPQPGDRVIFHWPGGNPMGDHFGTFRYWINKAAGEFSSREGNTSDMLADRTRYVKNVVVFVRVAE